MADIFDMVDTWNNGATTFTAIKMDVTDTASAAASLLMNLLVGGVSQFSVSKAGVLLAGDGVLATPGYAFSNDPDTGIYRRASGTVAFSANATAIFQYTGNGLALVAGVEVAWLSGGITTTRDVVLARDAAGTLAQRNGANAQTLRVYNTYTDASNYERADIGWLSNTLVVGTANAGTGSSRTLQFNTGGTGRFLLNTSGHFLAVTDNTYDIGSSAGNRPRDVFAANRIVASGVTQGSQLRISDGIAAPGGVAGVAVIYVDTADGDLKVVFSDGVVKTLATDT